MNSKNSDRNVNYDVVIVGGGIVGLASAYQILKRNPALRVAVIEKEKTVAAHQTGHNSGVIHSGIYYRPGSLKAQNCRRGYDLMLEFIKEHGISHEICGKIILAVDESELPRLAELKKRAELNGLENIRELSALEIQELEPSARGIKALHVPQTGIVNFREVAEKMKTWVAEHKGEIRLGEEVLGLEHVSDEVISIRTNQGTLTTRFLVNCGGLQSDRLAKMAGAPLQHRIIPFRGEYYKLNTRSTSQIKNLIYPVPNPELPFLGVHVTRMVSGEIEAGPNAFLAFKREGYHGHSLNLRDTLSTITWPGFYVMAAQYWRVALTEMKRTFSKSAFIHACKRLVPDLRSQDFSYAGCGIRAQAIDRQGKLIDDFLILRQPRALHICNAPSPAATSSLSIGMTVAEEVEKGLA